MIVVRRVTAADGVALREVRLRALQDAPSAFASTYDAEVDRPQAEWDDRAARAATGATGFTALALDDDRCIGLVGGYRDPDTGAATPADVELVSMWVAPSHRGSGVAAQLVDAVLDWACGETDACTVGLWVTRGNDAAQRLYERLGFVETGDVQPLPSDPCKDEVRMVFGLRAPSDAAR